MNVLEQRFLETVPGYLREIADSVKAIAKKPEQVKGDEIWVLFDESLSYYELIGRSIAVYTSEDEARSQFKKRVEESRKNATENGWEIGSDNEEFFEAYPDGSWGTSHETVELFKTVLNNPSWCHV